MLKQATLITFLSSCFSLPTSDPLCEAPSTIDGYDWVYAASTTGVWYTKTEDFVSWEDCPTECQSIQGQWAKTLNQDELSGCEAADWWVDPENITGENLWISALLIGSGGAKSWYWADGEKVTDFFWREHQPDERDEPQNCMYMAVNGWGDIICHKYTQRCMCEFRC